MLHSLWYSSRLQIEKFPNHSECNMQDIPIYSHWCVSKSCHGCWEENHSTEAMPQLQLNEQKYKKLVILTIYRIDKNLSIQVGRANLTVFCLSPVILSLQKLLSYFNCICMDCHSCTCKHHRIVLMAWLKHNSFCWRRIQYGIHKLQVHVFYRQQKE